MVWREDEPVGCCALLPKADGEYELGKMAVAEHLRGQGIGRILLDHTLAHARIIGAKRLDARQQHETTERGPSLRVRRLCALHAGNPFVVCACECSYDPGALIS